MKNTNFKMIKLISIFSVSTFLLFLSSCSNEPIQKPVSNQYVVTEADKKQLTYLKEVEWPKAYREQDTILLDRILGDDFKMIDASGNWYEKADELAWIKKNAMKNDSFRYEIKRFEILENGTAIICGTGHIFQDTTESIYQSSNVLVKRDSVWKAVLSHVSGIKEM